MPEIQIDCVIKKDGVIASVGSGANRYTVQAVVDWLRQSPVNLCYTFKAGKKAIVEARFHSTHQKWYLTTDPDDTKLNNLDFLPECR